MANPIRPEGSADAGASSVELGLLLALVASVVIGAASSVGVVVADGMRDVCDAVAQGRGHGGTPSGVGGGLLRAPGLRRSC